MNQLAWLDREPFFAITESQPQTVREWQRFVFEIASQEIYSSLPSQYTENPDDESFPSSVRRWYGQLEDRLFVIDVFYDFFPNTCHIQIPFSGTHKFGWQSLLELRILPPAIRTNQVLGISNDAQPHIRSVFRTDDRGIDFPIYDGTSDEDAESLLQYLNKQNLPINYSVGNPEPDINWVVKELVGEALVHRARYNSRTSAINVGCEISKTSDNEFVVFSESLELDERRYSIRFGNIQGADRHG